MPDDTSDDTGTDESVPSGFSAPDGFKLARELLRKRLPHDIHDYILEGICKGADGKHVVSVVKTGGGKSSYFYGYMLLLQELSKLEEPPPCLLQEQPKDPLMVVIYPTKGLEEEQAKKFHELGLNTVVINEDTLAAARRQNIDLWKDAVSPSNTMLLLSPEQLTSKSFDHLLQTPEFQERIVALGVDEIHLILDWGSPSFRKSFRDIGLVLARMPQRTRLFAVTATLPAGAETVQLTEILGLKPGSFFFSRRSNLRPDVKLVFRTLRHGLGGKVFPDLDWIVNEKRKTLVYCDTIALAFRVFLYLWHLRDPSEGDSPEREKRFRLYCSLFPSSYNEETRYIFINDPDLQVIFATDALKVGNDFPNVADVVILNPKDPNSILQEGGRAGRQPGLVSNPGPRVIVYVTKSMLDRARALVDGKTATRKGRNRKKKSDAENDGNMTMSMALLLLAACYTAEINRQYDNPLSDPRCTCETCRRTPQPHPSICDCSGCDPEPPLPPLSSQPRQPHHIGYIPKSKTLNVEMEEIGRQRLALFRYRLWESSTDPSDEDLPPSMFLPDSSIKSLLSNFAHLTSVAQLNQFIGDLWCSKPQHQDALFKEIQSLSQLFDGMRLGVDGFTSPYDEFFDALRRPVGSSSGATVPPILPAASPNPRCDESSNSKRRLSQADARPSRAKRGRQTTQGTVEGSSRKRKASNSTGQVQPRKKKAVLAVTEGIAPKASTTRRTSTRQRSNKENVPM